MARARNTYSGRYWVFCITTGQFLSVLVQPTKKLPEWKIGLDTQISCKSQLSAGFSPEIQRRNEGLSHQMMGTTRLKCMENTAFIHILFCPDMMRPQGHELPMNDVRCGHKLLDNKFIDNNHNPMGQQRYAIRSCSARMHRSGKKWTQTLWTERAVGLSKGDVQRCWRVHPICSDPTMNVPVGSLAANCYYWFVVGIDLRHIILRNCPSRRL